MAVTAAVSVASFSVVLAEAFVAIGMSTLVPAVFVETVRMTKDLAAHLAENSPDTPDENEAKIDGAIDRFNDLLTENPGANALKAATKALGTAISQPTELNLLLPKTATLEGEFEFHAAESYALSGTAGGGASIQGIGMVTVNAGYSALYEARSSNHVKLRVNFETVNITISASI